MRVRSLLSSKTLFGASALGGALVASASAFAQAVGGTIGAQIGTMAQEFSTAGGTAASTAMYVGGHRQVNEIGMLGWVSGGDVHCPWSTLSPSSLSARDHRPRGMAIFPVSLEPSNGRGDVGGPRHLRDL